MATDPQMAALIAEVRAVLDRYSDPGAPIGGSMGAHYAAAFPASGSATNDDLIAAAAAMPPAQTWTPAPGKAGPAWCYPNPANTPGAANPLVTQETIASTIAMPNWTSTVRPPVSVTRIIKAHIMARDGLTGDPSQWELDHWWPICAGGAVCDLANFWCMPYSPYPGAREKDHVEVWLKEQIVAGRMTLEAAHQALNDDWYAIFLSIRRLGLIPMMVAYDPDGSSDPDDNA
jgi:hypothetical protein